MKTFNTVPQRKFAPSKKQTHEGNSQLVVDVNEKARRITNSNLHDNLKWLRNERNKFERQIAVKHDFLITQAHRQVHPDVVQQHCDNLSQIDAELRNMYTQLEQLNHAVHDLQLQITGKKM